MSQPSPKTFDVALSYASEDRAYVEVVASTLVAKDIRVFYDQYEEVQLWGKNLYQHLSDLYERQASVVIIFISRHYLEKAWTRHELASAQAAALNSPTEFLLPVQLDNTKLPGLLPTTAHLDGSRYDAASLAIAIERKLSLLFTSVRL